MKLLFAHGWGFDRHFWQPLAALLPQWAHVVDDRGYFGAPCAADIDGPCLAVTHSFGTMRVLADPPPGLVGIVAFNGFERFTALPAKPGVPVRVVDRMIRRFDQNPDAVLADFRQTCGCGDPFGDPAREPLRADLLRLRDARSPRPHVPVVAVHGGYDPLLPADMRATAFAGCDARCVVHQSAGHLLPLEDPEFCAQAVRGAVQAAA